MEANGNIDDFMREMHEKRKLLDEQIHKFIAQKEREFKRFEQELRNKYRSSQATTHVQHSSAPAVNPHQPVHGHIVDETRTEVSGALSESHGALDAENLRSRVDRRVVNPVSEYVRPSYEREKDFMGLFTPSFLPLINGEPETDRPLSAPPLTDTAGFRQPLLDRTGLERANTEPSLITEGAGRPGHGQRTPSSGSEGLVSVLKTSGGKKSHKPMRVMLQLADDQPAVHPTDDLPTEREYAPVREAEAMHHSKQPEKANQTDSEDGSAPTSPSPSFPAPSADPAPAHNQVGAAIQSNLTEGPPLRPNPITPSVDPGPVVSSSRQPEYEDDIPSPFPLDEEVGRLRTTDRDWEVDFEEDIGSGPRHDLSPSPTASPILVNHRATVSLETKHPGATNTPGLNIRSSSSSSNQPISPGFSRPSVKEDPVFESSGIDPIDDTDVVGQGSFYDAFARPSYSSRNNMSGSLGQSYMQRNAENMVRNRRS